jgi:hypothetical protein
MPLRFGDNHGGSATLVPEPREPEGGILGKIRPSLQVPCEWEMARERPGKILQVTDAYPVEVK